MYELQYAFWALAATCQLVVGALMFSRRLHLRYPVFFSYTLLHVVRSVALFTIFRLVQQRTLPYADYFLTYWTADVLTFTLSFVLVYRISMDYFRNYELVKRAVWCAWAIGIPALLFLNLFLVHGYPGSETVRIIGLILLLQRSVSIIQVGLFLMLVACSRLMALPWRTEFSFGISLGLAICSCVELFATFARSHYGSGLNTIYSFTKIVAYLLAVVVWVVYILPPRRVHEVSVDVSAASANVEDWNQALGDLVE